MIRFFVCCTVCAVPKSVHTLVCMSAVRVSLEWVRVYIDILSKCASRIWTELVVLPNIVLIPIVYVLNARWYLYVLQFIGGQPVDCVFELFSTKSNGVFIPSPLFFYFCQSVANWPYLNKNIRAIHPSISFVC